MVCLSKLCESALTEIHDVVPTDRTVVHHDVPGPQRHSIPLGGKQEQTLSNTFITDSLVDCDIQV